MVKLGVVVALKKNLVATGLKNVKAKTKLEKQRSKNATVKITPTDNKSCAKENDSKGEDLAVLAGEEPHYVLIDS